MQGCAKSTMPLQVSPPPPDLAAPCEPPPQLEGTTGVAVMAWALPSVYAWRDCAARHRALVQAWPK